MKGRRLPRFLQVPASGSECLNWHQKLPARVTTAGFPTCGQHKLRGTAAEGAVPFIEPADYKVAQATRETVDLAKLVNNGNGSYTYTFKQNLASATMPSPAINPTITTLVGYDQTLTHRVLVDMGGHAGPTGEATKDFVPNGSAVVKTRNIVETATCQKCHGPEFAGHGGDRVTVDGCVTCHSPNTYDAQSGETVEMSVMIHKIHAGNELASMAGSDGQYYDNPNTTTDETADNGKPYAIWGNSNSRHSWETVAFPGGISKLRIMPHRQSEGCR